MITSASHWPNVGMDYLLGYISRQHIENNEISRAAELRVTMNAEQLSSKSAENDTDSGASVSIV